MTEKQLDEILAYCEKAAPGPWDRTGGNPDFVGPPGNEVAMTSLYYNNGEFIARSRTDLPRVVEECKRLREALELYADYSNWGSGTLGEGKHSVVWLLNEHGFKAAKQALQDEKVAE